MSTDTLTTRQRVHGPAVGPHDPPGRTRGVPAPSTRRPHAPARDHAVDPTLVDIFEATVAAHGDRVALDTPAGALTYDELAIATHAVAKRLRAGGVGPGDRIGIRVPSGTADL